MTQKESAMNFLSLAATGKVEEAYEKYIDPSFIHHNQYFKGDRQSLKLAMTEASKANPHTKIQIKKVLEDGDTVMTHSQVNHSPESLAIAVVHIFRFKNGKVVELWDLGQQINKDSPNENGMF